MVSALNRRQFGNGLLGPFAVYALLREARATAAITDGRLTARRWLDRQEELAQALTIGSVSPTMWHDEVNRLAAEVDVGGLMAEVHRGQSSLAGRPFMRDPVKRNVHFLDDDGVPRRLAYAAALFSFDASNVITPYAHRHMASAHMVVDGKMRIRTFDRVSDQEGAIVIRPTGDHVAGVGSAAAMTSAKDNIHWFVPATEQAMTFDVIVDSLDPGEDAYVIQPVDLIGGHHRADGTIVAPILTFEESMRQFTLAV